MEEKQGICLEIFTCIKYNGNSVVDYPITSPRVFDNTPFLKVGELLPWLSDHCPLFSTRSTKSNCSSHKNPKVKAPKHYVWSEDHT